MERCVTGGEGELKNCLFHTHSYAHTHIHVHTQLRVSNFTDPDGYVAISSSSFCDPTSNIFHNLTVRFDQNNVSIVVSLENGGQEQVDLQLSASGQVLVSIGNVPGIVYTA